MGLTEEMHDTTGSREAVRDSARRRKGVPCQAPLGSSCELEPYPRESEVSCMQLFVRGADNQMNMFSDSSHGK